MQTPYNRFVGVATMILLFFIPGSRAHAIIHVNNLTISAAGQLRIAPVRSPLPLLTLSAQQCDKDALLTWHTEDEGSTDYYEVERSMDARFYLPVGRVQAGHATGPHLYRFMDAKAEGTGKTFYYRLKAVDIDQNVTYTPVVRVSFTPTVNAVSLFPTLVDRPATLQVALVRPGALQVRIADNAGRLIHQSAYQLADGITSLPFDLGGLPRGMYYMEIHGAVFNKTIRFVRP